MVRKALGLYPVHQIALRSEAVAHLRHRVTLLNLLVGMPAFVGDFYNEFRHCPILSALRFFRFLPVPMEASIGWVVPFSLTSQLLVLTLDRDNSLPFQYRK